MPFNVPRKQHQRLRVPRERDRPENRQHPTLPLDVGAVVRRPSDLGAFKVVLDLGASALVLVQYQHTVGVAVEQPVPA